jgi:hypothetical protein
MKMKYILLIGVCMGLQIAQAQKLRLLPSNLVSEKVHKPFMGKKILDLGMITACGGNEKYFYISNVGSKPLQIMRIESSLKGCGSITYPKKPIAPGATDSIKVERMTCCYTGTAWETLDVYTNEPGSGLSKEPFIVKSTFDAPMLKYDISKKNIRLDNVSIDSTYSFRIINTGNRPLKIGSIQSPDKNIFISFFATNNVLGCGSSLEVRFKVVGRQRSNTSPTIELELFACYDEKYGVKDFVYVSY